MTNSSNNMNALVQPRRGFDNEEFEKRFEIVQGKMREQQLAAILLTTEHDINYYTGYLTQFWQSPTRPWYLVLPSEGLPIAVIPTIGVECMAKGWMTDIRNWSSPHPTDDGISLLTEALVESVERAKASTGFTSVGISAGRETHMRMPLCDLNQIKENLHAHDKQVEFVDASLIMRRQRMVKSPNEIEKLRYVAQTVSSVFDRLFDFVHPGMSDAEVFREFKIQCLTEGVDDVSFLVGGADQGGYGDIISPAGPRKIRDGDVLILDTGCTFDGYYCDFDRNYGFGKVDQSAHAAYEAVWEATEQGFKAAKPGNTPADLFHAMNDVLQKAGALGDSVGRYGHGLGLQLTEPPSNTPWDDEVFEVGTVMTLEPGMKFAPGKLMVHEENIVITKNGAEYLSRRALPKMPIYS